MTKSGKTDFFDRNRRLLLFHHHRFRRARGNANKSAVDLGDQAGKIISPERVVSDIGRNNLRGEF